MLRHVQNMQSFGLPVVVALNHSTSDTEAEFAAVRDAVATLGVEVEVVLCRHWAEGGAGAAGLARAVLANLADGSSFRSIYEDALPLADNILTVAQRIYHSL